MGRVQPINVKPLEEALKKTYGAKGKTLDEVNRTYGEWAGYWLLYLRASTMEPLVRSP